MSILDYFSSMEIEGVGHEIVSTAILSACVTSILILVCLAWESTGRRPLDYEIFLVEMHTFTNSRVVEVLHLSSVFRPRETYSRILSRVRERVRNRQERDGQWLRVSDTNVVIRSPSTVGRSDFPANASTLEFRDDPLTLFEIELPPDNSADTTHDSQIAAAAAIAILGRGDGSEQRVTVQAIEARPDLNISDIHHLSMNLLVPSRRGIVQLPSMRVSASLFSQDGATPVAVAEVSPADDATTNTQESTEVTFPTENTESVNRTFSINQVGGSVLSNDSAASSDNNEPNDPVVESVNPPQQTSQSALIRLKFLDDTLKETRTNLDATVAQFRLSNFADAVSQNKIVRLIFQGQLLRDDSRSLESYGVQDGSVIHCNISDTPYTRIQPPQPVAEPQSTNNGPTRIRVRASRIHRRIRPEMEIDEDNLLAGLSRLVFDLFFIGIPGIPHSVFLWTQANLRSMEPYIRPTGGDSFFERSYLSFYTRFVEPIIAAEEDPNFLDEAAQAAARPISQFCIGDYLVLIFGVQCALVWAYVYYFPQLCDRTAIGLLILLTLYFIFVVLRNNEPPAHVNPPTQPDQRS